MASLIVAGNTSGTVTLQAPDVSGSTVLTLPTTSGTIVTTGGGASVPFAAGSAASPSITFTGDTNTGIFSPGADTIAFSEGGVESMRIDSSGNLLLGETAQAYSSRFTLSYNASTTNGPIFLSTNSQAANFGGAVSLGGKYNSAGNYAAFATIYGAKSNSTDGNREGFLSFSTNGNATDATERMRIDSSGRLLVNRTATGGSVFDACRVQVTGNISVSGSDSELILQNTGSASRVWRILSASGGGSTAALRFYDDTAGVERMRIDVNGFLFCQGVYDRTTGSAANIHIGSGGDFFRSTSSIKYKKDIQDATHGLAEVLQLRPVTYKGKAEFDGETVFGGLIAEEVHEAGLTEFVQYADDGTPDALAYGNMVSLCIKAIQEQQALITDLTTRLTALENK